MPRKHLLWVCSVAMFLSADHAESRFVWTNHPGGRVASLQVQGSSAGFSSLPASQTGVSFTNQLADSRSLTNQIYLNGSGVAAGDVNGDGLCDLYFCGLDNPNELYLNLGGFRFRQGAAEAGVACADQASTGAVIADIDGDEDQDLLVSAVAGGVRLFLNNGSGKFEEATRQFGLQSKSGAMSMALADADGDGFLDLYVVNYRSSTFRDEPEKRFRVAQAGGRYELQAVDGRPPSDPGLIGRFTIDPLAGLMEHGEDDAFFRNRSGARFERVAWGSNSFLGEDGRPVPVPYDWGLSAMFHDINGDGAPDLYVCNDFQSEDRFWINDGSGGFRLAPRLALRQTSLFSMGVDFADLDHDGRDEIFVADMLSRDHQRRQTQVMTHGGAMPVRTTAGDRPQYSRNTLFWQRDAGRFAEIAQFAGVHASEWSWCPVFLDVDLDGRDDLIVTTGHARDAQNADVAREIELAKAARPLSWMQQIEMRKKFPRLETPLLAFRNQGSFQFQEASAVWGFTSKQVANGLAAADLDEDGDLDLVANVLHGPALICRNNSSAPRLAVRLKGFPPNTSGVGARIEVSGGPVVLQSKEMTSGGRYLSGDAPLRAFAAGAASRLDVRVRWRSGRVTEMKGVAADSICEIDERSAVAVDPHPPRNPAPIFADESPALAHEHKDQPFSDADRQPLLPRNLSNLGPGVSWFDLDGDGWEELLVSSGRGGSIAIFKNASGKLQPETGAAFAPGTRDRTTLLGWVAGDQRKLLIGSANYEDGLTNGPAFRQLAWSERKMDDSAAGSASSTGPLALGDADGDGDLDLFLGGRATAALWSQAARSSILRNDAGSLKADPALSAEVSGAGMVSAALWSDLNGDGAAELLLACDAGPLRVFAREASGLVEQTARLGLNELTGFWNSINTGDFDGDGRMDIVAGNWGRNSQYRDHLESGLYFYFGDPQHSGVTQVIEASHDRALGRIVPLQDRDTLALGIPDLKTRFPSFHAYGAASVGDILGASAKDWKSVRIATMESIVLLNRGGSFIAKALPWAAQLSPVFGLCVGDIDADGKEDLVLAQNFFGVRRGVSRHDAGQGLLLLGNGDGTFRTISSAASGIDVPGEGRGAALADFDRDGRIDVAIGQNNGPTKLYRNQHGQAGITVKFRGPATNPLGIGASARLQFEDGSFGPRHEVHAGEGYWSQPSASVTLGSPKSARAVEITWPGGAVHSEALPGGSKSIEARFPIPEAN